MSWVSQVPEPVMQGLQITVVGMSLVFFTLGLIILALILLTRLPWLRAEKEPEQAAKAACARRPVETIPAQVASTDDELAQVAAIAVALLRSRRKAPSRSGAQTAISAWKTHGRARQLGL